MKKIIIIGLALLSLSAHAASDIILRESFEQGIPAAWKQECLSATKASWAVDSLMMFPAGAAEGAQRVALRNTTNMTQNMSARLVSPVLNLQGVVSPQLIFSHAQVGRTSTNFDTLTVSYRTSATSRWKTLKRYTQPLSVWHRDTLALVETNGEYYQLAFTASDNLGRGVVLDDIVVRAESTCAPAASLSVQPLSDGAILRWEDLSSHYFEVYVTRRQGDPSTMSSSDIAYHAAHLSTLETTVKGLDKLQSYYAYLRTECPDAENGYTRWLCTPFRTSLVFPYSENFDATDALPGGWSSLTGTVENAYAGYLPEENSSATFGWRHTKDPLVTGSSHALCYFSSNHEPCWLVMPSVDLSEAKVNSLGLRFRLSMTATAGEKIEVASKTNYRFYVLISNDGGQSWSVTQQTLWAATGADYNIRDLNSELNTYFINLDRYIGSVVQIAFVAEAIYGSAYYHLDNVTIDEADAMCGGVSHLSLTPDVTSVKATWKKEGKHPSLVEISTSERFLTALETASVSGTDYTFKNLEPHTMYYVRVRQDCEDNAWTRAEVQTPDGVPYYEPFDKVEMPDGWVRYRGTSKAFFGGNVSKYSKGFEIRTRSDGLPANHLTAEIYEGDFWAVSPLIRTNVSASSAIRITFRMALTEWTTKGNPALENYTDRIWFVVSRDGGKTWKSEDATLWSSNDADKADYSYNAIPRQGGLYRIDLTKYIGSDIRFAFGVETPVDMVTNNRIHIDDIRIEEYDRTCQGLSNLTALPMPDAVQLSWNVLAGGNAAVDVELSTDEDFAPMAYVTKQKTSQSSITLSSLLPLKRYYARVRQQCSDMDEDWIYCSFETSVKVPYIEHFATSGKPEGWTHLAGDYFSAEAFTTPEVEQAGFWSVRGSAACLITGVHLHVHTYSRNHFGISTPNIYLSSSNSHQYQLSFRLGASAHESVEAPTQTTGATFAVLVSVNGGAWQTLDAWGVRGAKTIESIDPKTETVTYDLSAYDGKAVRLCFYSHSTDLDCDFDLHVDDIRLRAVDPTCQGLENLQLVGVTEHTATLRGVMTGTQSALVELYQGEKLMNSMTTTGALVELKDLIPNTLYTVRARQACDTDGEWLSAEVHTLCGAVTPTEFGLENFTDEVRFDCWRTGFLSEGTTTTAFSELAYNTLYGYYLHMGREKTTDADKAYAISPELMVDDTINRLTLNLRAATTDVSLDSRATLIVGVLTDPVTMSFAPVDTLTLHYASAFERETAYAIDLKNYDGDYLGRMGHYIVFIAEAGDGKLTDVLIDDVYFGKEPIDDPTGSCGGITNLKLSTSDNRVTASWSGSADRYEAIICSRNSVLAAVDTVVTTTTQAVFSNLNYSTNYYVYVRAVCPDGKSHSVWSSAAVTMTALGIPYLEKFNDTMSGWDTRMGTAVTPGASFRKGSIPTGGWSLQEPYRINGFDGKQARTEVFTNDYNAFLTSPAIYLNAGGANEGAELSFKLTASSAGSSETLGKSTTHSFGVYISTDDGVNFTRLAAWTCDGLGDYDYNTLKGDAVTYTIDVSSYLGKKVRLGFMSAGGADFYPDAYVWVDDVAIRFSELPGCRVPARPSVEAGSMDAHCVWSGSSDWYELAVIPAAKAISDDDIIEVHCSDTVIRSLTPGTDYAAYVRGVCGSERSEWSAPAKFTSSCVTTIPVRYGFEDPNTWQTVNKVYGLLAEQCWTTATASSSISLNYATLMSGQEVNPDESENGYVYAHSGKSALYLCAKGSNGGAYATLPAVELPLDTLQLTFYARPGYYYQSKTGTDEGMANCDGTTTLRVGTLTDPKDISTFKELQQMSLSIPTDPEGNTKTRLDEDPMGMDFWRKFKVPLAGAKGRYITFAIVGGKGERYLSIDDIEVSIYSDCDMPLALKSAPSVTTADLTWLDGETVSDSYQVWVWNDNGDTLRLSSTSKSLHVTGLAPMTLYHAQVRAICSATDYSEWTEPIAFTTDCDTYSLPWMDGFEEAKAGEHLSPMCWELVDANRTGYPTVFTGNEREEEVSDYIYSGKGTLYIETSNSTHAAYLLLPRFDAVLTNQMLCFYYRMQGKGSLSVGYVTDEDDMTTFVALEQYGSSSAWSSVRIPLRAIPSSALEARLAISVSSGSGAVMGIDDMMLSEIEACQAPLDVRSLGAGLDTAWVAWSGSLRSDYTVELSTSASFATVVQKHNVSGVTNIHLTDLKQATHYYVRVRRHCTAEDESEWSETGHLLTAITLQDNVCFGFNYTDPCGRFVNLPAEEMTVGDNHYISRVAARQTAAPDSTFYLTLRMDTAAIETYHVALCEGDRFEDDNFRIEHVSPSQTVWQRFYEGGAHCDSLVVLRLSVSAMARVEIHDTIYADEPYEWAGRILTEPGTYMDTTATATGCDSITTLHLHLHAKASAEIYLRLCHGETYTFEGRTLTESGTYTHRSHTAEGRDSVTTLFLTILPVLTHYQREAICHGELYSDDTFLDLSRQGRYRITIPSADGCDSIVTLDLLVADFGYTMSDTIGLSDLPYYIGSQLILPQNTEVGVYTETVALPCGDVLLTVKVQQESPRPEGVESVVVTPTEIRKILIDGVLYIERDGVRWSVLGTRL